MSRMRKAVAVAAMVGGMMLAGAGAASADATANGVVSNSPGVLSGNLVQIPVDVPINVCGNSVNLIGALNPAGGNTCSNGSDETTTTGTHSDNWVKDCFGHEGWHHWAWLEHRVEDCC